MTLEKSDGLDTNYGGLECPLIVTTFNENCPIARPLTALFQFSLL